jgi:hypothetical protein
VKVSDQIRNAISAAATVAALSFLAGCGTDRTAIGHAPTPTATIVDSGARPLQGSSSSTGASTLTTSGIATGKHDHLGQSCSGRDGARFGAEGMVCIVGRLQRKSGPAAAP